jgi:hypothetical protein
MNKQILFFYVCFHLNTSLSMQKTIDFSKNYYHAELLINEPDYIKNAAYTLYAQEITSAPCAGLFNYNNGEKIFSNTHKDKILTLVTKVHHLPLSILDINTYIDRPYQLPAILSQNETSAIHLLDEYTPVIAQNKEIHILKEQFSLLNSLTNFYSQPRSYRLSIKQTLIPVLSKNNADHITTIDNSDSYLVSISKEGHITTWRKNNTDITDEHSQTMLFKEKIFSSGIYKTDNILCLGLENGTIAVITLNDLKHKTITLFPNTPLTINWIKPFLNELFFATLCTHNKKNSTTECCRTKIINTSPSCKECQRENEQNIRKQVISIECNSLIAKEKEIQESIKEANQKTCEHVIFTMQENKLPELCNNCANQLVFTTISAKDLDQQELNITKITKTTNSNITELYPLSHDRIIALTNDTKYSKQLILLHNKKTSETTQLKLQSPFKIAITEDNLFSILHDNNQFQRDNNHKTPWGTEFRRYIAGRTYSLYTIPILLGVPFACVFANSYQEAILITLIPTSLLLILLPIMAFIINFPNMSKALLASLCLMSYFKANPTMRI